MLVNDYIVSDNVLNFNNIDEVVSLAKSIPYYTKEKQDLENTVMVREGQFPEGLQYGYRSDDIMKVYPDFGRNLLLDLFYKTFDFKISYEVSLFFDVLPDYVCKDTALPWKDDSSSVLTGVVFLNKEPPEGSGVEIKTREGVYEIQNRFNRMVIHKSRFKQRPLGFFGSDLTNARLCLTVNIRRISFVV